MYVVIVKILTFIIKTYFPNNEILKNIGTANGIFKKAPFPKTFKTIFNELN